MKRHFGAAAAIACALAAAAPAVALAHDGGGGDPLSPGNLLVSGSTYREADIQPGVTQLPPGCTAGNCATATSDGAYPYVFNNDLADGSFGVTSPIFLWQLTPSGDVIGRTEVPTHELVTSFSSKSELALNLSTTGRAVTFMGYVARPRELDVSNSNTPGAIDPTNPVSGADFRAAARLDRWGHLSFTETNAYSGNNGRAAVLNDEPGANVFYTAGNAGNGANPQPAGVVAGAGAQIFSASPAPEAAQSPGAPTPVGSFSVAQLGDKADKIGKDDNFRGLTVADNVVYFTKGSGSNGVDTVYFVDTTGKACPNGGVGLPVPGAKLPTAGIHYDPSTVAATGLTSNMCILRGFNTALAKNATDASPFPFGIWFANPRTLYVADEGGGDNAFDTASGTYSAAAASTTAGLQKWVLTNTSSGPTWQLAYTLQGGLALGKPYVVPGYPIGDNTATMLPWAPATGGLRNITGRVNRDGSVTIWAVTSTVSGSGDPGADPNQVVAITDNPSAQAAPAGEAFHTVMAPRYGRVVRGVSLTPGGFEDHQRGDVRKRRDRARGRARRSAH
ncbi:MAG TPA: hypothetical protein VNV17_02160 [Solirubrobacteraceae bacterium]|nr:hypothetical protein [Solirubrobacteraceae bacterium]